MKIFRRTEFLKLPAGTVYAKGEPWALSGLLIKDDSLTNDWFYLEPAWIDANDSTETFARLEEMLDSGASYPMADAVGRDGCFNDKEIFLVFEREDLERLKQIVARALEVT